MSKFEDRLWRELVRRHGADLAEITSPAARRARRARPRLLAGTTAALAGVATAAALLLSAASSPPAFAVSRNADGSITVSLHQIAAIHAANARLAALGIRAKLVEVTPGCAYRALPPAAIHAMALARRATARGAPQVSIARFDPREIPAGKWRVLPAWPVAGHASIAPGRLAAGSVPPCLSFLPPALDARCAGVPPIPAFKSAPAPPAYSGVIRRARALAKAAATVHERSANAENPPKQVAIGCPVTASR